MKTYIVILLTCLLSTASWANDVDKVLVIKSRYKMFLISSGEVIKEYNVVFGNNPIGHKLHEGDERTPEGKYFLDYKNINSSFYKSIHISYPNETDIARSYKHGLAPGGMIMIHGQRNGFGWLSWLAQNFNWTNGCIAVTNSDMDDIWERVNTGTPIEIIP